MQVKGSEGSRWRVLRDRGITVEHLQPLVDELHGAFTADDIGFAALGRIPDPVLRAVVSDQICQSVYAISENLLEAQLHQEQLTGIVGDRGLRMPKGDGEATVVRGAEMDMAITGCVRAIGSALDCLAATAIGVLRIPESITKASFSTLASRFPTSKAAENANHKQARAWSDWSRLVKSHESYLPTGWFDWEQDMRNLNIHRGRQVHTLLQRLRDPEQPQVIVPTDDPIEITKSTARFDLHLRNRPRLPDMQDFITAPKKHDLWITEPATTTLSGILRAVNALTEEASQFLLSWWRHAEKWGAFFPPPIEKWKLEPEPPQFMGVLGISRQYPVAFGVGNPHLVERLKLAESLRSK
jgi:hypothetical protein